MQSLSIGLVPESAARLRHEIGVALADMEKRPISEREESE